MPARRAPDGPNRLVQSAITSSFDGSLDGRLRSARPAYSRNIPATPDTSTKLGGQIYRVADQVTDVNPGDYLMDLGGTLWFKDPLGKWVHSYEGYNNGRELYDPEHAASGPDQSSPDILLGPGNGYHAGPTSPTGSTFLGGYNTLPTPPYYNGRFSLLGYYNSVLDDGFQDSTHYSILIAGNGNTVLTHGVFSNKGSHSIIYGSSNNIEAQAAFNVRLFGAGNQITSSGGVSDLFLFGDNNAVLGSASTLISLGTYNSFTDSSRSWILGSRASIEEDDLGILVAKKVKIERDSSLGGTEETALSLTSDNGSEKSLTVSDDDILLLNGTPVTGVIGYDHVQSVADDVWTVDHELGHYPIVQVYDDAGYVVEATIQHTSVDQTVITFSDDVAGGARFI